MISGWEWVETALAVAETSVCILQLGEPPAVIHHGLQLVTR